MNAASLRRKLDIQQQIEVPDNQGGWTKTWQTLATVPGAREPLEGRELFQAQQVNARLTTRIRIRYPLPGGVQVKPQMRVTFGSNVYEIHSVANVDDRDRELSLMCEELQVQ